MQKRYELILTGFNPLLMHRDNISFGDELARWRKDPANKKKSVAGDDRTPAFTWLGCLYHDDNVLGVESDNLMTMLREGGQKCPKGKGNTNYKADTQTGIVLDQWLFNLYIDGKTVPVAPFKSLMGEMDFSKHEAAARDHGFELFVKRAKIGTSKHVRVRPIFRKWELRGGLTVLNEDQSGLTMSVLKQILAQAGSLVGLGDWRPSSKTPGTYGTFTSEIRPI